MTTQTGSQTSSQTGSLDTWPSQNPPKITLDEMLASFNGTPHAYTPRLFVWRGRGGIRGPIVKHLDLTPDIEADEVIDQLLQRLDGPATLIARMRYIADGVTKGAKNTEQCEIDLTDPSWWASRPPIQATSNEAALLARIDAQAAMIEEMKARASAPPSSTTVVQSDPFALMTKMFEMTDRMTDKVIARIQPPAPSAPSSTSPTDFQFWLKQGTDMGELKALVAAKAGTGSNIKEIIEGLTLASPMVEKAVSAWQSTRAETIALKREEIALKRKELAIRQTMADAALLKKAQEVGVEVAEQDDDDDDDDDDAEGERVNGVPQ
jgi:hypothetical protein